MKTLIKILCLSVLWFSCSENKRQEVISRYDGGQKKLVVSYKGKNHNEIITERVLYSKLGDTIFFELPQKKNKNNI